MNRLIVKIHVNNNDFNNGKQKKCEVICNESSENESTTLEGKLDDLSSVQTIDFDGKAQDGNLDLELATDMKHSEDIHNIYDNEHSYEYYKNNASTNVEDSSPAFMVGKAIIGTMKAHRYMKKMIYYFICYLQNLHLL